MKASRSKYTERLIATRIYTLALFIKRKHRRPPLPRALEERHDDLLFPHPRLPGRGPVGGGKTLTGNAAADGGDFGSGTNSGTIGHFGAVGVFEGAGSGIDDDSTLTAEGRGGKRLMAGMSTAARLSAA